MRRLLQDLWRLLRAWAAADRIRICRSTGDRPLKQGWPVQSRRAPFDED